MSDFSEAPGIVALAAAAAALIALIWLLVLSFRFRRVRSAQKTDNNTASYDVLFTG